MFKEPVEISSIDIIPFITSQEICVVKAKGKKDSGFNKFLQIKLKEKLQNRVSCAWIDIGKIDLKNDFVQLFITSWMKQLGLHFRDSVPSGYYLFQNGNIKGYHPGTLELDKIDPQLQGPSIVVGAIAGILVGLVEKNPFKGIETFLFVFEFPQGQKIFEFFLELLLAKDTFAQERQRNLLESELLAAYKLLGVLPNATLEEIRKARNEILKNYHPDKKFSDFEKRNKITAEINHAYDLIIKARKSDS